MTVTALVENECSCGLDTEHGLSLYIETDDGTRILFDMGQGPLFAKNAAILEKDIAAVDIAVISHGHYDHGGGLSEFLRLNSKAKVYVHRKAFEEHFSIRETGITYIGLNRSLAEKYPDRICLCGDSCQIAPNISLFAGVEGTHPRPAGNRLLLEADRLTPDCFRHEQNLIVCEGNKRVLFAGCAHCGIANILEYAGAVTHVFAGFHLIKDSSNDLELLASELLSHKGCMYYTMHCTGTDNYRILKGLMHDKTDYLSCGRTIKL
ncbi:MAG: MBL fold metallo-hydrolase [Bacteroidaceae bacterium]|nr:MBL fold metallo-hydrolase [Candidatus Colenecus caballi]MCQ2072519.1 MBL fold metallo-hydrolase [Bacteroidaceae bacterium]